jgi:CCR4-NOT transcription complex subunit 7/8
VVPIVQLGITLCDEYGNLPLIVDGEGRLFGLAWEVTFSDFDIRRDRHVPGSVTFLRSHHRASASNRPGRAPSAPRRSRPSWQPCYRRRRRPTSSLGRRSAARTISGIWSRRHGHTCHEFMAQTHALLGGGRVFDAKYMTEHCERADL